MTIGWSNPSSDRKTRVISLSSVSELTSGSLPNGQYTLTIHHSDVTGYSMSADVSFNFHRLYGDFYNTGTVNAADSALISSLLNVTSSSSSYIWYVDGNDDGDINFADLLEGAQDTTKDYTDASGGPIWLGASTTLGVGTPAAPTELAALEPREFYYSSQWQVLQESAANPATGTMQTAAQYVWGAAYVNEMVLRDYDSDGSTSAGSYGNAGSGLDQRIYPLQDANYNVTALVGLVSGTWEVVERFTYTPYGLRTVLNASGDQTTDSYNWLYGFQGGRRDAVTGLIGFQNRNYDPESRNPESKNPGIQESRNPGIQGIQGIQGQPPLESRESRGIQGQPPLNAATKRHAASSFQGGPASDAPAHWLAELFHFPHIRLPK